MTVVALLGSAGATPPMELNIACRAVAATLEALGIDLVRIWQGLVMTSLDMAGISITLLRLPGGDAGVELLALLDAPTGSTAWPGRVPAEAPRMLVLDLPEPAAAGSDASGDHDAVATAAIGAPCRALLAAESEIDPIGRGGRRR